MYVNISSAGILLSCNILQQLLIRDITAVYTVICIALDEYIELVSPESGVCIRACCCGILILLKVPCVPKLGFKFLFLNLRTLFIVYLACWISVKQFTLVTHHYSALDKHASSWSILFCIDI